MENILSIEELNVSFEQKGGVVQAVRGASLSMRKGEIVALVGESGSGKSVTAQSILRLNPSPPAKICAKRLELCGVDVLQASEKELQALRGRAASMVFQDPMTSLNPTMKVGKQITERLYRKDHLSAAHCKERAVRLLEQVQIPEAALRAEQYPHQFSGGMRQRVMLAMALAGEPELLIADEPTTALDVTTQRQILKLIAAIRRELGTAVLLITHDFGVVANLADRVAVMYAGRIVEQGDTKAVFHQPSHPYTRQLLQDLSGTAAHLTDSTRTERDRIGTSDVAEGCPFLAQCSAAMRICEREEAPLFAMNETHHAACWRLHECAPKERLQDDTVD